MNSTMENTTQDSAPKTSKDHLWKLTLGRLQEIRLAQRVHDRYIESYTSDNYKPQTYAESSDFMKDQWIRWTQLVLSNRDIDNVAMFRLFHPRFKSIDYTPESFDDCVQLIRTATLEEYERMGLDDQRTDCDSNKQENEPE